MGVINMLPCGCENEFVDLLSRSSGSAQNWINVILFLDFMNRIKISIKYDAHRGVVSVEA